MKHCDIIPNCPGNIKVGINTMNSRCIPSYIYKTVVLKPNFSCCKNVLCQRAISEENVKYVIKYDFDLLGDTIVVPKNCILDFDGGSLKHGTIVGQDTLFINIGGVDIWGDNLKLEGTWIEYNANASDRKYDPAKFSGMGKVYLKKNIIKVDGVDKNVLVQDAFYKDENGKRVPNTNTVFVVMYDFDLNGESIQMPEGSVLDFEGGNFTNGTLISDDTEIIGKLPENTNTLYGQYYKDKKPLSHNLKVTQALSSCVEFAFFTPSDYIGFDLSTQGILVFYYNNQKYHLIGGHSSIDGVEYSFIVLFDANYRYVGSTRLEEPGHGGAYTIKGDKLYIGMYHKVVVFNVSNIISCCTSESQMPHNVEYTNRPSPIQTIDLDFTVVDMDYDAENKEFILMDGSSQYSIYDENFNLKRYSNVSIEQYLRENELNVYFIAQGIAAKNGVGYCCLWVSDWNGLGNDHSRPVGYDWSGSVLCTIDTVNDKIISWEKLSIPYQDGECEGLCKNPDNDDELYFSVGVNVPGGSVINAFCKTSSVDSVYTVTTKRETDGGFVNSVKTSVFRVDNTYDYVYGPSDGSTLKPFATIGDAIAMMVAKTGDVTIGIQSDTKDYILPPITLYSNKLSIRGIDDARPMLIGNIGSDGGKLDIRKCKIKTKSPIRLAFASSLYLENVDLINNGSDVGVYVLDGSTMLAYGVTASGYETGIDARRSHIKFSDITFNQCTQGISVNNSTVSVFDGYFNDCNKGIFARRNDLELGYVHFENVNICFSVDDSLINTWNNGIILGSGIQNVIYKDEGFRGRVNLMMKVYTTEDLQNVFNFIEAGAFNATTVGFIVVTSDVQHNGITLERGTYTYVNPGFLLDGYPFERIIRRNDTFVYIPNTGTFEQRPALTSSYKGFMYYDTTLNLNTYWNGSSWIELCPNNSQFRFNHWKKLGELNPSSETFGDGAVTVTDSRYDSSSAQWTEKDGQCYKRSYAISNLPFSTGDIIMFTVTSPMRNANFIISATEIQAGQNVKTVNIIDEYNADLLFKKIPDITDCNSFFVMVNSDSKYFDGKIEIYKLK